MTQGVYYNPNVEEILQGLEQAANESAISETGSSSTTTIILSDDDFKDLTNDDDDENLTFDELAGFSGGLRALDGNDTVTGSGSGEAINGNVGFDILFGESGADTLRGGRDSDRVFGGNDNDIVNGNRGDDLVVGGDGDDLVRGGQDEDLLVGGEGEDTLIGDYGTDDLIGNAGNDLFVLRTETGTFISSSADWIIDYDATDDSIGLTGGLSENDLSFETISFALSSEIVFLQEFTGEDISTNTGITTETLDPNGDGSIEGVLIRNNDEDSTYFETILGVVLNTTESDLQFETVSEDVLGLG